MIPAVSIYIQTGRQRHGEAWCKRYPDKADDLYVVGQIGGKKKRVRIGPPTPENQRAAEHKVREWKQLIERKALVDAGLVVESFAEAADVWLRQGLRQRAPKTVEVRVHQVQVLGRYFGQLPLDRIGAGEIAQWWEQEVDTKRSARTGQSYLNALSMIFRHAAKSHPAIVNPVPAARDLIFADVRLTAEFRASDELNCNPLTRDELARLLPAVDTGNPDLLLTVLLCYEAGLRLGEALGLQWGDVWWGRDDMDTSRHVHIRRSRSNGKVGHTKSGRSRKVGMSRRLRSHLQARYLEMGRPAEDAWLIGHQWGKNIRKRLIQCCASAKIRPVRPKDFRDTYASTLVTHGIVLKWVSLQLGHSSLQVTEQHYASYMAMDGYQNPWMVPEGGLPSDLFAQRDGWASRMAPKGAHMAPTDRKRQ